MPLKRETRTPRYAEEKNANRKEIVFYESDSKEEPDLQRKRMKTWNVRIQYRGGAKMSLKAQP
jgi:hypothetical protein